MSESVCRMDALAKVTGKLKFASDLRAADMLYAVPVLSDQAHAKIRSLDVSLALRVPGCVRVYTGSDVPNNRVGYYHDHPVICDDKVRFYGDIVAVVAAETLDAAQEAAKLVHVQYDPLPLIETMDQSLSMERGKVHDQMQNNICHQVHHRNGDVDEAFARCSHIVENEYRFPAVDHCFLETECGLSAMEEGKLVIRAGSQNIYYDRSQVAEGLGLSQEEVVVIAPYCGGAFGGKGDISVQCLIGLVTLDTGRPCKMQFTREQRFINGVKRHPGRIRMKTGMDENGILLAHTVEAVLDTGAYTVFGNVVLEITTECCTGPYRIPNVCIDTYSVYTNNGSNGAFRGFGAAQGCFAVEGQINALSRASGIDAIELRLKNCLLAGERSAMGHVLLADPCMRETLQAASGDSLWRDRAKQRTKGRGFLTGVGVACGMKGYGIGVNNVPDYGFAQAAITREGAVKLTVGCNELGQGSFTAMGVTLALAMRIQYEEIGYLALSDSDMNEETGATASSRVTYAVGRAVEAAGKALVAALRDIGAKEFGVDRNELEHVDGGFRLQNRFVPFADLAKHCEIDLSCRARIRAAYSETLADGGLGHPHVLYSANAQIARVQVDTATGLTYADEIRVYVDVGHCMSTAAVEGQSDGGVVMGISYALLEKIDRKEGRPLNTSFSTYMIPTTLDVPKIIENHILEIPEPSHPFGAKGMAENATVPTAPAVVDAVNDALGTNITEIPVSPELLMSFLGGKQ